MNKNKLIIDIREELEKQIDALQNNISQENKNQEKIDYLQNRYKEKKIEENSKLLGNCTRLKIKNNDLYKEVNNLKGINRALQKKIFNLKQEKTLPKLTKNNSALNLHSEFGIEENNIINAIKDNYIKNTNEKLKGTISDPYSLNSQSSIHPTISNHLNSGRSHKNLENSLPTGSLMTIKHLK